MRSRTAVVWLVVLLAPIVTGAVAWNVAQSGKALPVASLVGADDETAATMAASRPAAFKQALETLKNRSDQSIHSARDVAEQRKVQYDAAVLNQGLRLARIYASATGDRRPLRLFAARKSRIEGTVLLNQRNYQAGLTKLAVALAEAEQLGDVWLQIITLTNQAYGQAELGQLDAALQSGERARALAARDDVRSRALTTYNLASLQMHLGQFEAAVSSSREAIQLTRQIGNRLWEGNALLNLGVAYRQLGRIGEARETLETARDVLLMTKNKIGVGRSYYNLALVAGDAGDYWTAVTEMGLALPIIRSVDIRHSHEIENRDDEYFNPIEETALELLSFWYGELNDVGKATEYAKARDAVRANRPPGPAHTHEPGKPH